MKKTKHQTPWIFLLGITIVILVGVGILKNTTAKSLQFNNTEKGIITKEDAVAKIKDLQEVIDYLKRVPNGIISINGEEDNEYLVQVYEFKNDHTTTFNWYKVDKTTGEVKKEF